MLLFLVLLLLQSPTETPSLSVIAGRVFDEQGRPVAGANAVAHSYGYDDNGDRVIRGRMPGDATTDQLGEFQIIGLRPGEYIVSVEPRFARAGPDGAGVAPVTTYYPGTKDPRTAASVRLGPGEEYRLNDVTLGSGRLAAVRLVIVNSTGEEIPEQRTVAWSTSGIAYRSEVGEGDQILIPNVAPGSYEFAVGWRTQRGPVWANTRIDVHETDVEQFLEVRPPNRLIGRVALVDAEDKSVPYANVKTVLSGGPAFPFSQLQLAGASQSDGTFVIEGIAEGSYPVRFFDFPDDVYVAAATDGARDILAEPLRIAGETTLDVVLRRDSALIEGVVTDFSGQKISDAVVVLVPDDPIRGDHSRYRTLTPESDGAFRIRGVAPGSYQLFAWPELNGAAYRNAEFIKRYEEHAQPLTVQKNERITVNLQVINDRM